MAWLQGWKQRIPITIDPTTISGGVLSEDLSNFPARINISNSSGRNSADLTRVFDELPAVPPLNFKEHKFYSSFNPVITFSKPTGSSVRLTSSVSSLGQGYVFLSFSTAFLQNKKLKYTWANYSGDLDDWQQCSIYDGFYDRSSGTDFPSGSGFPGKGYGFLQQIEYLTGSASSHTTTETIDVSDSTQDYVTIFWFLRDAHGGTSMYFTISNIQILDLSDNVVFEVDLSGSIVNEQTGTYFDYSVLEGPGNHKKIAVTISDGTTQCPVEIDNWDANTETADLWVKIPTIASGTNTQLYLYYESTQSDNTEYIADTPTTASGVWTNDYFSVYHMNQDPSSSDALDSTSSHEDLEFKNMDANDLVAGKIGQASHLDGGNDHIQSNTYGPSGNFSVEAIIKTDLITSSQLQRIMCNNSAPSGKHFSFHIRDLVGPGGSADLGLWVDDNTANQITAITSSAPIEAGVYYYVAGTFDEGGTVKCFINGVLKNTDVDASFSTYSPDRDIRIGCDADGLDNFFDGILDEIRISNTTRSDDWIKTTYQSNWNNLLIFEDTEYDVLAVKYLEVSDITDTTAKLYGEILSDYHDAYVNLYYGLVDGGTAELNWNNFQELGLKLSGENFSTTISGLVPFNTYFYRWYTTYSGSEPSEEWSPSYYFYVAQSRVLKGTSNDFIAVVAEPNSTFYNTKFAVVDHLGLNVIEDDVVSRYYIHASGWREIEISIDSSKISSTLTDFPLLVMLDSSVQVLFDSLGSSSKKFKILDENDDECYVEIESWDESTPEAILWVKVPSVSSSSNTILRLLYNPTTSDNDSYIGETSSVPAQNVWDDNFLAVYHLEQTPAGAGSIKDSTSNGYDGNPIGVSGLYDCMIGKGLYFSSSGHYINVSSNIAFNPDSDDSDCTVEVVVKRSNAGTSREGFFQAGNTDYGSTMLRVYNSTQLEFNINLNGQQRYRRVSLSTGDTNWHYYAGSSNVSASQLTLVKDESTSTAGWGGGSRSNDFSVARVIRSDTFTGYLCDFRYSNYTRSNAWLSATGYSMQNDLIALTDNGFVQRVSDLTSVR